MSLSRGMLVCLVLIGALAPYQSEALQPDVKPLRIYSWRADTAHSLSGVTAMVWAKVNYGELTRPVTADYDTARDPLVVADEVAAGFATLAAGQRAVLLWHAGVAHGRHDEPGLFPHDEREADAYAKGGYVDFTARWMTRFWRRLAAHDARPDYIVLDYEDADGFWGLSADYPRDAAFAAARNAMRAATPDWPRTLDRESIVAFNNWQSVRRARALHASIFEPAAAVWHADLPGSNFAEQERRWPGKDSNDWSLQSGAISGSFSSPVTYLGIGGQRYTVGAAHRAIEYHRALNWLDARNGVRSALAVTARVAPWYSNPDLGADPGEDIATHRLLWAAGLLYDRVLGVQTMLFWSDRSWTTDEVAFARPFLTALRNLNLSCPSPKARLADADAEGIASQWLDYARRMTLEGQPADYVHCP